MHHKLIVILIVLLVLIIGGTEAVKPTSGIESIQQMLSDVDRGRYVAVIMCCNDCHTPDSLVRRSNVPEDS